MGAAKSIKWCWYLYHGFYPCDAGEVGAARNNDRRTVRRLFLSLRCRGSGRSKQLSSSEVDKRFYPCDAGEVGAAKAKPAGKSAHSFYPCDAGEVGAAFGDEAVANAVE